MINIKDRRNCCGCTACASICSQNAINMETDAMGFKYPVVDVSKCVDCGLCDAVCAFNENYDCSMNLAEPIAYGVRHKDINEVLTSRSGAVFIAISDWVLDNGGVVYGVGYTDHFRVVHKRATTKEERNEFKGSKYVQSDMNGVFKQVKLDLKSGLKVLFSGTPCQVAGLTSYVGKKLRENLYLVDIVCHGVPAPNIWRDYLSYIEKRYHDTAVGVDFRDKTQFGWAAHSESISFADGKKFSSLYSYLFCQNIMFRPSCGVCYFSNLKRPGDVTIADFWGWNKTDANFNSDNKGVSLTFCNTQKGLDTFNNVSDKINYISTSIDNCIQPNLEHPTTPHPKSEMFEDDYINKGFKKIALKYGNIGIRYYINILIKKTKTAVKLIIKK